MVKKCLWIAAAFVACAFLIDPREGAQARPFPVASSKPSPIPIPSTSPLMTLTSITRVTGPSPEFKAADQAAALPSSPTWAAGSSYSLPRGTALEPVPGTGSLLPIGGGKPTPITLKIDPDSLKELQETCRKLAAMLPEKLRVDMNPTLALETSPRLSRLLTGLEWLLLLAGGLGTLFGIEKLSPLVARLVAGLRSITSGKQPESTKTVEGMLSTLLSRLPEGKAEEPSSTMKPAG